MEVLKEETNRLSLRHKLYVLFTKCHWIEEVSLQVTVYSFSLTWNKKCYKISRRLTKQGNMWQPVKVPSSAKLCTPDHS